MEEGQACTTCKLLGVVYLDGFDFLQFYGSMARQIVVRNKKMYDPAIVKLYYQLIEKENVLSKDIIIVIVPSHPIKRYLRGKSAFEHIEYFLKKDNYQVLKKSIYRAKLFSKQKLKTAAKRIEEIKTDFMAGVNIKMVENKSVILIDDVCTTGATINRCAQILKEAGAKEVKAFTIFRSYIKKDKPNDKEK